MPHAEPRYAYIWEFTVKKGCELQFEQRYGPEGEWARLFSRDMGYVGTELHRDINVPGRYVTIDHWISKEACDAFRVAWENEFQELDEACEALTMSERLLGSFDRLL
jgi:heme-degrading monooxygenase HmoA